MCGIAGVFDKTGRPADRQELQAMCDAMVHRGPNDEGYFLKDGIGLGMRRLSVIDLATGHQPVRNEDGSVQVVQNGEIYNYRELRRDLEARGHTFYTATDTEVLVHLYEEYGSACVDHLRGMFAFAIWDDNKKQLMLARDRLGIKPLYYGDFGGRLVFASELKAILQLPWVERDLNLGSLSNVFSFLSTPRNESIIDGVHKLPPGHILTVGYQHGPKVRQYWDVNFETDYSLSEADCVERLRELLNEAVKLRMISDVPLGGFLSGGIDSSAVVAFMAKNSSRPVKTFSIGFPEAEFNETQHAREVSRAFGTEHHELILEAGNLGLDDLAWQLDEPFGDPSALPTYLVSKLASEHVTVCLSGDGGDELFAGYDKYVVEQRERRYQHIPAPVRKLLGVAGAHMKEGMKGRRFLRHIALDGPERFLDNNCMFGRETQQSLFSAGVLAGMAGKVPWQERIDYLANSKRDWLSTIQYLDMKNYLPQDILTKVDRMSMANSLEVRVPLLDHKLVEFAATIPPAYRLRGSSTKHIFKRAMRGILPDSIIDRRKQGFAVPLGRWFRGELHDQIHDLLLSDTSRSRDIFNHDYIEKLLAMHKRGRPLEFQIWTLISFELWCRTFLDKSPAYSVRTVSQGSRQPAWGRPVTAAGLK